MPYQLKENKPNRSKVKSEKSKKKKRVSIPTLKNNLWRLFSEYIRIKDSDKNGYVKCCTCDVSMFYKDPKGRMQAGHYEPKKYCPPLYYDEVNVNPQCSYCNSVGEGRQYWHAEYIRLKYGEKELHRLHKKSSEYREWKKKNPNKTFAWERTWIEDKIQYYSENLKKEKHKRGL